MREKCGKSEENMGGEICWGHLLGQCLEDELGKVWKILQPTDARLGTRNLGLRVGLEIHGWRFIHGWLILNYSKQKHWFKGSTNQNMVCAVHGKWDVQPYVQTSSFWSFQGFVVGLNNFAKLISNIWMQPIWPNYPFIGLFYRHTYWQMWPWFLQFFGTVLTIS